MNSDVVDGVPIGTPVLLIIFKRPELTRRVLQAIAAVRPRVLLVAADGPRSADEKVLCDATREILRDVNWPCEVRTNYADQNLGCGVRVYTAIDWAMDQFEELIILEDDCIPDPSFFYFCQELLERYRSDTRLMHISGNNFLPPQIRPATSYYFSKYTHAWGWATWRRAWKHFDWSLKTWPALKQAGLVELWCEDAYEQEYWSNIFERMSFGAPDVWDYQWNCSVWAQNGLVILPSVNLVSNIGFGSDATHTQGQSAYMNLPVSSIGKLLHPPFIVRNRIADAYTFEQNFGGAQLKHADTTKERLKVMVRPLLLPVRVVRKVWRAIREWFH